MRRKGGQRETSRGINIFFEFRENKGHPPRFGGEMTGSSCIRRQLEKELVHSRRTVTRKRGNVCGQKCGKEKEGGTVSLRVGGGGGWPSSG